jgi:archaellum biogenesis ATPase FlaH
VNLKREIGQNDVLLIADPGIFIERINQFSRNQKIGYVTTSKTFVELSEICKEKKISVQDVIFIDAFTATLETPPKAAGCFFASSPGALTELRITIKSFLEDFHCKVIIFDKITDLLSYCSQSEILKFLYEVILEVRPRGTKLIIIEDSIDNGLHDDISMFIEKFIEF